MRLVSGLASSLLGLLLLGCASTSTEMSGAVPSAPLCQQAGESLSALVLWSTQWRPDQKEVALREEAARQGLDDFFAGAGCFASVEARRLGGEASAIAATDPELLSIASTARAPPDRVLWLTVRELGQQAIRVE